MNDQRQLLGFSILLLEDDFIQADDIAGVLRADGAEVVGPFGCEHKALASLETTRADGAVLDVRLRLEPSFIMAHALVARGVPIAFLTGYEPEFIPDEFRSWPHLLKPVDRVVLLQAVRGLCTVAARR